MDDGTVNDFSRGDFSPQQHTTVKIEGSIWLSIIAFGVAMLALGMCANVLLKDYADKAYADKAANAASAPASVRSQIAEREARVAQDQNHIQDGQIDSLNRRIP
jgi:hypothetical protein